MKLILNKIWNFLIEVGELRAEYIKKHQMYRGY